MEWKTIPGFEGKYEASDTGLIRSLDRNIPSVSRTGKPYLSPRRGRILKPGRLNGGHLHVVLDGRVDRTVHSLILETFVGPCPPGMMARHRDDDPANNNLENLSWGTRSENSFDAVANGRHWQARKTHCKHGHPLSGDNLAIKTTGHRQCKQCQRRRRREHVERKATAARACRHHC